MSLSTSTTFASRLGRFSVSLHIRERRYATKKLSNLFLKRLPNISPNRGSKYQSSVQTAGVRRQFFIWIGAVSAFSLAVSAAALVAAQLEKSKVGLADRQHITAVVMDDGGFSEILF